MLVVKLMKMFSWSMSIKCWLTSSSVFTEKRKAAMWFSLFSSAWSMKNIPKHNKPSPSLYAENDIFTLTLSWPAYLSRESPIQGDRQGRTQP